MSVCKHLVVKLVVSLALLFWIRSPYALGSVSDAFSSSFFFCFSFMLYLTKMTTQYFCETLSNFSH
jgi:hypothetical protein